MTFQGNPQNPETEQLYIGSSEVSESLEPPTFHDIHEKAEDYHQLIHEKGKNLSDNLIYGMIPLVGPATETFVEADTAGTALWTGTNVETGEKFNTMGERMKFVAKHEAKTLWGAGKTALDVALWTTGIGEVNALAKLAKGAGKAGKIGKTLHIAQEGSKVAGVIEKVGVKAVDNMAYKATAIGVDTFRKVEKVEKVVGAVDKVHGIKKNIDLGRNVVNKFREISDMTTDPDAKAVLDAQHAEWEAMMANPETRREIEHAYESSDFKKLVDAEHQHMQEDPEYAQQVLEQMQAWEAQYREANAQHEQHGQRQAMPA